MNNFNANTERELIIDYLKTWFNRFGENSKAIIGISGGKDSTICAAVLVRALGKERVFGVIMPDKEMPDIDDAIKVCECLGIEYQVKCIYPITKAMYEVGKKDFTILPRSEAVINTNTPARIRMTMLYLCCAAQSVPAFVINTCNRSEDYVGYSTKYGDSAGDVSVLQDLLVSEVLAIGDTLEEIPYDLVHKTPSDGMCGKSDEDNLGFTYNMLDTYIRRYEDKDAVLTEDKYYKDALLANGLKDELSIYDFECKVKGKHIANLHKLKTIPSYKRGL